MWVAVIDRSVDLADKTMFGPFNDEDDATKFLNDMGDEEFEEAEFAYVMYVNSPTPEGKSSATVYVEGDKVDVDAWLARPGTFLVDEVRWTRD